MFRKRQQAGRRFQLRVLEALPVSNGDVGNQLDATLQQNELILEVFSDGGV